MIKVTLNNKHEYIVKDKQLSNLTVCYKIALRDGNLLQLDGDTYINPQFVSEIQDITKILDEDHDFVLDACDVYEHINTLMR